MSFRSLLVLLALMAAAPAAAQEIQRAPAELPARDSLFQAPYARTTFAPTTLERSTRGKRALVGALAGLVVSTVAVVASDPGSWDCGGEFCGLGQSILIISGATTAGAIIGYMTKR